MTRSFCSLPEDLRAAFDGLKRSAAYAKGQVIFHESQPCHSVFVVCAGRLRLETASSEGKVLLLRFAFPGDLLGTAEAVSGRSPYLCSAIATEPSIVGSVPESAFMRFVEEHPQVGVRLTIALSEQYSSAQRAARLLSTETSISRLARLLLAWSDDRGSASLSVTHSELGQAIGSTRETITRTLSDLAHRGLIERKPNLILIRAPEELARLAISPGGRGVFGAAPPC